MNKRLRRADLDSIKSGPDKGKTGAYVADNFIGVLGKHFKAKRYKGEDGEWLIGLYDLSGENLIALVNEEGQLVNWPMGDAPSEDDDAGGHIDGAGQRQPPSQLEGLRRNKIRNDRRAGKMTDSEGFQPGDDYAKIAKKYGYQKASENSYINRTDAGLCTLHLFDNGAWQHQSPFENHPTGGRTPEQLWDRLQVVHGIPGSSAPYRTPAQLTTMINKLYPAAVESLHAELAEATLQYMAQNDCDFPTALREVTRHPRMAKLWEEHQATHTQLLVEGA
jgi:hypothetical protein